MKTITHKAFKFEKSAGGISEYVHKKNGLRVLVWEDHSAPVVALNVTYLVGSRNEAVGHTGATHLLEHLMFKGSKKFNAKTGKRIDEIIFGMGAKSNGTTWFDRTNYWELMASERLPELMALEADRMRGAILKNEDLASEMTVVRNEFERHENEPADVLDKEVWATAYREHPYHHPTIGWRSDVENVSIERLREFYNTYYWPNNACVIISGNITARDAMDLVEKYFGNVKRSSHAIPQVYTSEPKQEGERRIVLSRTGEPATVIIAHKGVSARDADAPALEVLAGVLSKGRASRLYKLLVDKALATNVASHSISLRDPGLFTTQVSLVQNISHNKIEKVILNEYERIKLEGVSEAELAREKYNAKVEQNFAKDGPLGIALALTEGLAMGDWTIIPNYANLINKVTCGQVQEVARKYLVKDAVTIGHFVPKG